MKKTQLIPLAIILLFQSFIGFTIYKDYGLSWDESTNRQNGIYSALYINYQLEFKILSKGEVEAKIRALGGDDEKVEKYISGTGLLERKDKDYGVIFELFLVGAEAALKLTDTRDMYFVRHLLTHCFFLLSLSFFYVMLCDGYDWRVGTSGTLLLLFSPRIFGHSFYNSKDLVFMCAFLIALSTLYFFLTRPNIFTVLLHALSSAIAVDIRIPGVIIIFITIAFIGHYSFINHSKKRKAVFRMLSLTPVYLIISWIIIVSCWPYLWDAPIDHFFEAFENMKNFRWNGKVMYGGELIQVAFNLPWHYIPVWMGITSPEIFLILYSVSTGLFALQLIHKKHRLYEGKSQLVFALGVAASLIPLFAIIFFKSVLYNGWRHAYFIYPPLIICASHTLFWAEKFLKKKHQTWVLFSVFTIAMIPPIKSIYDNHPYQSVYFNLLVSGNPIEKYEGDYWGISYREGLERILEQDESPTIRVYVTEWIGQVSAQLVKTKDRKRLRFVNSHQDADYLLTTYAFKDLIEEDSISRDQFLGKYDLRGDKALFNIRVDDFIILSAFKV